MKKVIFSLPLAIAVAVLVSVPVFAHSTEGDTVYYNEASSASHQAEENKAQAGAAARQKAKTAKQKFSSEGSEKAAALRMEAKDRTTAMRTDACKQHKDGATSHITRIVTKSESYQAKIDAVLVKAESFYAAGDLTVANYSTLDDAAIAAQAASSTSIATMKSLAPTIDCTKTDNAEKVATFRAAAKDARDNLKTYRQSVKDLLLALKTAKQTAEGSQN